MQKHGFVQHNQELCWGGQGETLFEFCGHSYKYLLTWATPWTRFRNGFPDVGGPGAGFIRWLPTILWTWLPLRFQKMIQKEEPSVALPNPDLMRAAFSISAISIAPWCFETSALSVWLVSTFFTLPSLLLFTYLWLVLLPEVNVPPWLSYFHLELCKLMAQLCLLSFRLTLVPCGYWSTVSFSSFSLLLFFIYLFTGPWSCSLMFWGFLSVPFHVFAISGIILWMSKHEVACISQPAAYGGESTDTDNCCLCIILLTSLWEVFSPLKKKDHDLGTKTCRCEVTGPNSIKKQANKQKQTNKNSWRNKRRWCVCLVPKFFHSFLMICVFHKLSVYCRFPGPLSS